MFYRMKRNKLIMAPGPTNVPVEYMEELALEFPHHRTQEFAVLLNKLQVNLKKLLEIENGEILVFTSSGTGAMESSVVNFFSPKDKVLVIDIGFFGKRYRTLCERFGLEVICLSYDIGQTYDIEDVKKVLAEHPDLKAVFATHHETSTGVLNNLEILGELTKERDDTLFIVDTISGAIMHPLHTSDWHIDVVTGGSQKGFLIPPGLSFVGLSQKALAKIDDSTLPRFYWDYRMMLEMAKKGQTPSTPAINLMQALLRSTEDLLAAGLEKTWEHHAQLRTYLEAQFTAIGFRLAVEDESIRGNVVVPVFVPEGTNGIEICQVLENEHNIIIVPGLGEYATQMLRVGIIGPLTTKDVDIFIDGLKKTVMSLYQIEL